VKVENASLYDAKKVVEPDFNGANFTFDETFIFDGKVLQVFIASYVNQTQGRELIHWKNEEFINSWQVLSQDKINDFIFTEAKNDTDERVLIVKKYKVGDISTVNKNHAKLYEILKPLMVDQVSSAIIIASNCDNTCEGAKKTIKTFLTLNAGLLD
jgi:EpsI family protein